MVTGDPAPQLTISVMDEPGQGGAHHEYFISWPSKVDGLPENGVRINFQNGPIKEHGVNGVTQEALLAVIIDRLKSFQSGPFACASNASALISAENCLVYLKSRTIDRINRGVEGQTKA